MSILLIIVEIFVEKQIGLFTSSFNLFIIIKIN